MLSEAVRRGGEAYRPERRVEKDMLFGEGGGIWSSFHTMWVSLVYLLGHKSTTENLIVRS